MSKQKQRLAEEFADIIRNELNNDELEIVNKRNAENGYKKESCATHDFIDANQSMLDAMESLNIEVDLDSDKQITLINEAWQIAQESNFALSKWNPGDQANPAVMCEMCQAIDTPIGGDYIMTVSEEDCKWIDRENHKENQVTNQYTPEDVPTVLRRMFSDAIKLSESWEADGNKDLDNFEHGKFITESLDEWAYNFANLADEYESLTTSTSRREWRDYWKDYTDDLAIPEDWEDVTYHNDELPCFQFNNYRIWLNAPTLEERRATLTEQGYNPDEEEDWRFQIDQLDKDGCVLDTLDDIAVLRTLDFDEVVKFTAFNFVSKPRV